MLLGELLNMLVVLLPLKSQHKTSVKEDALLNMLSIYVTLSTFHNQISELKDKALENISHIWVTSLTSQDERSELKDEAPENVPPIFLT